MTDKRREIMFIFFLFFGFLTLLLATNDEIGPLLNNLALLLATGMLWYAWVLTLCWDVLHIFTHLFIFSALFFFPLFFLASKPDSWLTLPMIISEAIIFFAVALPISFMRRRKMIGTPW